jgi:hypothetical protein
MTFGPGRGVRTQTGFCDELPADGIHAPRLRVVYEYWRQLQQALGHLPGRQHLDPATLKEHLPFLWMVDVVRTGPQPRFRYRLIGTEIVHARGRDDTGRFIDEVNQEIDNGQEAEKRFSLVVASCRPHWRCGPPLWVNVLGDRTPYIENIYMPLAGDGVEPDIVLVVNAYLDMNFREIALFRSSY